MNLAGRSACIMSRLQPQTEGRVVQSTAHDEYFLRVLVLLASERGRVRTRMESRQARVFAGHAVDAQRQFIGHAFEAFYSCPARAVFWGQGVPVGAGGLRHRDPSIPLCDRAMTDGECSRYAVAQPIRPVSSLAAHAAAPGAAITRGRLRSISSSGR